MPNMNVSNKMNASTKMFLNAAKYQGYSYDRFWVIKGKPTGCKITVTPRLELKDKDLQLPSN